jgi:hypothetical protein
MWKQRIVERHAGVRGDRRAGEVANRRKLGDRGHVIVDAMIGDGLDPAYDLATP